MRKIVFIVVFLFIAGAVFGQNGVYDFIPLSIDMVISELGKPVPPEYQRVDRDTYSLRFGTGTFVLIAIDGIVVESSIGETFSTTQDAYLYLSYFHNFFEDDNWIYNEINGQDSYKKDDITVFFISPYRRIDDFIVAGVLFRK